MKETKKICASCPVQAECLAYVMTFNHVERRHGVWGGTSERQRRVNPSTGERGPYRKTPVHGTVTMYKNYGCRCEDCRRAAAVERVRYAASRKPPEAGSPSVSPPPSESPSGGGGEISSMSCGVEVAMEVVPQFGRGRVVGVDGPLPASMAEAS